MANKFADRLPFTPKGEFVVTKRMRFGSKTWEIGEDFPVRKLVVDQRRLRVLYDGKFITMKGDNEPDEPEEIQDEELVAGEGEFLFDPEIHTVEHEDNEYWIADEDGDLVRVRAPMGKKLDTSTDKVLVTADDILAWAEIDEGETEEDAEEGEEE